MVNQSVCHVGIDTHPSGFNRWILPPFLIGARSRTNPERVKEWNKERNLTWDNLFKREYLCKVWQMSLSFSLPSATVNDLTVDLLNNTALVLSETCSPDVSRFSFQVIAKCLCQGDCHRCKKATYWLNKNPGSVMYPCQNYTLKTLSHYALGNQVQTKTTEWQCSHIILPYPRSWWKKVCVEAKVENKIAFTHLSIHRFKIIYFVIYKPHWTTSRRHPLCKLHGF